MHPYHWLPFDYYKQFINKWSSRIATEADDDDDDDDDDGGGSGRGDGGGDTDQDCVTHLLPTLCRRRSSSLNRTGRI